jgi:hypothetical protein
MIRHGQAVVNYFFDDRNFTWEKGARSVLHRYLRKLLLFLFNLFLILSMIGHPLGSRLTSTSISFNTQFSVSISTLRLSIYALLWVGCILFFACWILSLIFCSNCGNLPIEPKYSSHIDILVGERKVEWASPSLLRIACRSLYQSRILMVFTCLRIKGNYLLLV